VAAGESVSLTRQAPKDEYVGLERDHPQSYHTFMHTRLFSHIDIRPENVHILDGTARDLRRECEKQVSQQLGLFKIPPLPSSDVNRTVTRK
jgi:6-phosphogluconolactonase/glucosamine-6-phosphate isomerase/deaminase